MKSFFNTPQQYSQQPLLGSRRKKGRKYMAWIIACLLAVLVLGVPPIIRAIDKTITLKTLNSHAEHSAMGVSTLAELNNRVNSIISSNSAIAFGVSVNDLNTGDELNFGQSGPMTAASVSKVLTATDFLQQVELGNESMEEVLDDGNTAATDLQQMITVSSDSAWEALNDDLSYGQLQDYADQLGLNSYNALTNSLSASDTANLFGKLYQGKLINPADTHLLLSYMRTANYANLIVPAVPDIDIVYHKAGEYDDDVNDTAIITNHQQAIVLAIYTDGNGTYNWTQRANLMQQITTAVLQYYHLS